MNDRDAESLRWSWDYVARGLAGLLALLGWAGFAPSHMLRGAWRMANREMRYLEGMARRLVLAEAGALAGLSPPAPLSRRPARKDRAARPRGEYPRGFCLAAPFRAADHPCWPGPGRPGAGQDAPAPMAPGVGAEPPPVVTARGLAARIEALEGLIAAPEKAARRMVRQLRAARIVPCLVAPPSVRNRPLDLMQSAFFEAERLALLGLRRCHAATGPPR